jgi:hypothetical protein
VFLAGGMAQVVECLPNKHVSRVPTPEWPKREVWLFTNNKSKNALKAH